MILEAAKSIITATSALVRAASAAQRELIDQVCKMTDFFAYTHHSHFKGIC